MGPVFRGGGEVLLVQKGMQKRRMKRGGEDDSEKEVKRIMESDSETELRQEEVERSGGGGLIC